MGLFTRAHLQPLRGFANRSSLIAEYVVLPPDQNNATFYAGFSVNDFLAKQFHASYIDF